MNICMVGHGMMGVWHSQNLSGADCRLHTLVGLLAEPTAAFANKHGYERWTTDYGAALADPEIDAVIIATPSEFHALQAIAALERGKYVLVEIPIAMNLVDAERVIAVAEANRRVLAVCHPRRFGAEREALRQRIAAGEETLRGGSLIACSSVRAVTIEPGLAVYGSTKAAISLLVKGFASEVGRAGVRVNAIAPSIAETALTEPFKQRPDIYKLYAAHTVFNRWSSSDEVASAVAFLASDAASYVSGSTLFVDGGVDGYRWAADRTHAIGALKFVRNILPSWSRVD